MFIGQHYLEGALVTLKNPLIMVEKRPVINDELPLVPSDPSVITGGDGGLQESSQLSIEGYVLKKIIFKTRPKPVGLLRVLK